VKGHQDKPRKEFDLWERLKDDCDHYAGISREMFETQARPNV
jgi:hypothetical protein